MTLRGARNDIVYFTFQIPKFTNITNPIPMISCSWGTKSLWFSGGSSWERKAKSNSKWVALILSKFHGWQVVSTSHFGMKAHPGLDGLLRIHSWSQVSMCYQVCWDGMNIFQCSMLFLSRAVEIKTIKRYKCELPTSCVSSHFSPSGLVRSSRSICYTIARAPLKYTPNKSFFLAKAPEQKGKARSTSSFV